MRTPAYSRQFERDTKRMKKRGKNLDKLKIMIRSIVAQEKLDAIHRDHKLVATGRDAGNATLNPIGCWFIWLNPIGLFSSGPGRTLTYSKYRGIGAQPDAIEKPGGPCHFHRFFC